MHILSDIIRLRQFLTLVARNQVFEEKPGFWATKVFEEKPGFWPGLSAPQA